MLKVRNLIKNTSSSYLIYTNAEAYEKHHQISKTDISAKKANNIQSLTVFAKNCIPEIWPGFKYML